jgi:predicted metal-binding membrane protein
VPHVQVKSSRPAAIETQVQARINDLPGSSKRRPKLIELTAIAVVLLALLAWGYLGWMDWGMRHMEMGVSMWIMPGMVAWNAADVARVFLMWAMMMAAMMLPSALPVILLVSRVRAGRKAQPGRIGPAGMFTSGYLLAWSGYSVAATLLHWSLLEAGLVTPMMTSANVALSATALILAGVYQFTPFKGACLRNCRSPLSLVIEVAASPRRALTTGLRYGLYCVGCCWALMSLMFFAGVMNLVWMLIIAGYVAMEKLLPETKWLGRTAGILLCAAGHWLAVAQVV